MAPTQGTNTNPKAPPPFKACRLCDSSQHGMHHCPYRYSPTPLLARLMAGAK